MELNISTFAEMNEKYNHRNFLDLDNPNNRTNYINEVGFVGLCKEFCEDLCDKLRGKKVLGVMSGKGALEKVLTDNGIEAIATDTKEWATDMKMYSAWRNEYIDVEKIDAISAINRYKDWADIVIMAWPYMDDTAYEVAELLRNLGIQLLYIGEDYGGCTASDKFFDLIGEYNNDCSWYDHYFRFFGIYDSPIIIDWAKKDDNTNY